jgi:tripartite-type tricarboxylate transporter receptor subunit TctC
MRQLVAWTSANLDFDVKSLNQRRLIMEIRVDRTRLCATGLILAFCVSFSLSAFGQNYPSKPVNVYIGYGPGATTDLSARALGEGLEKLLGVPFVMENKPGATAGVAATMVARAKPDGYTLGVVSTGVVTVRPHIFKAQYDPLKDFTLIAQYSRYIGALTVRGDSPIKNVDDFVAYAKAHPGLSYSSSGTHSQQQMGVEQFRLCKGLEFTHLPAKGGAEANTLLLGGHVDFTAGSGQHMAYVRQGRLRNLVLLNTDERDPTQPDVPTMKDIGCQDAPALGYLVIGPKGLPDSVYKVLADAIRKVAEGPNFQKTLTRLEIPYDYKDRRQLEKETASDFYLYKAFLKKLGVKPD